MADSPELTWGDTVIVSAGAPAEYRPGQIASVVAFGSDPPLVTVEFGDGTDAQVPPHLLRKHDE